MVQVDLGKSWGLGRVRRQGGLRGREKLQGAAPKLSGIIRGCRRASLPEAAATAAARPLRFSCFFFISPRSPPRGNYAENIFCFFFCLFLRAVVWQNVDFIGGSKKNFGRNVSIFDVRYAMKSPFTCDQDGLGPSSRRRCLHNFFA